MLYTEVVIISLVAAASENGVIGRNGEIPWNLPDDLTYFRDVTSGSPIIMGRRTHESIGRPLPHRHNIVVTRQTGVNFAGCSVAHSLEEALELAAQDKVEEVFVIGGGEIYSLALPQSSRVHLTRVHTTIENGDAFFPALNPAEWHEVSRKDHGKDARHAHAFTISLFERVRR